MQPELTLPSISTNAKLGHAGRKGGGGGGGSWVHNLIVSVTVFSINLLSFSFYGQILRE